MRPETNGPVRSQLSTLFRRAFYNRDSPNELISSLVSYNKVSRNPTRSRKVVSVVLNCAFSFCPKNDHLVGAYLKELVHERFAKPSDFIIALIFQWRNLVNSPSLAHRSSASSFLRAQCQFLAELQPVVPTFELMTRAECRKCIILTARWLAALSRWGSSDQIKELQQSANHMVESVGILLITLLASNMGNTVMSSIEEGTKVDKVKTAIQNAVDASMSAFPNVSMQLMNRTQNYPALFTSHQDSSPDPQAMEMAALQFEAGITDVPVIPTRTATYVYLHALLRSASTMEDTAICAFLNARHSGNSALMFAELLFASFDAMTKAPDAADELYQAQCQIYLHNKLPGILAFLSSVSNFSHEQYLVELWNDLNALQNQTVLAAGRRFLHICAPHHLIATATVVQLTGDDGTTAGARGLYSKEALVEQVKSNAARGPRLIDELVKNDGNAGVISHAIVDITHRYCEDKETQHLKDMANALVAKPSTINAITMFIKPGVFLLPFCNLLDEWSWDDIHGESQPIYDEFGSVLLLIMAVQRRLRLTQIDLSTLRSDGFVAGFLFSGHTEEASSQLTEDRLSSLGDWVNALYIAEGLADELTSKCSPQEFYMLIPTLLGQSLTAVSTKRLSENALRTGLEYLLGPFLLPSLLPALEWASQAVGNDPKTVAVIMQVLLKPPSHPETEELHQSIASMARDIVQRDPDVFSRHSELQPVVDPLSKRQRFAMCEGVSSSDWASWTNSDAGVLPLCSRAIADLVAVPNEGLYQTEILATAIRVHGPVVATQNLVNLLLQYSGSHEFHQLLDIVATIAASSNNSGVTLRNAVQILHSRLGASLEKGQSLYAEAIVHLHRRVEMYAHALVSPPHNAETSFMPMNDVDIANINLDAVPTSLTDQSQTQQSSNQQQQTQALAQDLDQGQGPGPDQDQMPSDEMEKMLNDAAAMGDMGQLDTDMFDFGGDNYDLNMDLDMNMF